MIDESDNVHFFGTKRQPEEKKYSQKQNQKYQAINTQVYSLGQINLKIWLII